MFTESQRGKCGVEAKSRESFDSPGRRLDPHGDARRLAIDKRLRTGTTGI
jgi:hypothetical protein